ncbi:hypothetical protein ACFL1H_07595 [Nanoarchaeota archaeon]
MDKCLMTIEAKKIKQDLIRQHGYMKEILDYIGSDLRYLALPILRLIEDSDYGKNELNVSLDCLVGKDLKIYKNNGLVSDGKKSLNGYVDPFELVYNAAKHIFEEYGMILSNGQELIYVPYEKAHEAEVIDFPEIVEYEEVVNSV